MAGKVEYAGGHKAVTTAKVSFLVERAADTAYPKMALVPKDTEVTAFAEWKPKDNSFMLLWIELDDGRHGWANGKYFTVEFGKSLNKKPKTRNKKPTLKKPEELPPKMPVDIYDTPEYKKGLADGLVRNKDAVTIGCGKGNITASAKSEGKPKPTLNAIREIVKDVFGPDTYVYCGQSCKGRDLSFVAIYRPYNRLWSLPVAIFGYAMDFFYPLKESIGYIEFGNSKFLHGYGEKNRQAMERVITSIQRSTNWIPKGRLKLKQSYITKKF